MVRRRDHDRATAFLPDTREEKEDYKNKNIYGRYRMVDDFTHLEQTLFSSFESKPGKITEHFVMLCYGMHYT